MVNVSAWMAAFECSRDNRSTNMTEEATVLTNDVDGVLIITINRPKAKNAVNLSVAQGIAAALDRLDNDDALRVGVLTGAGGTFCAGMDLKAFVSGEFPQIEGRGFGGMTERSADKPLIAAVEGYALAGGCELAIACDLIVAAENAKFGIPEVKRGLVAAAGGLVRLPSQIPYRVAMELALTGEFMGAERAMSMGLINQLTAPGDALATARSLAAQIAENGPMAVRVSKAIIKASRDWSGDETFTNQHALTQPVFTSEDAIEGATAFAEKRKPEWKGR
jgi:enoyl-CoA hydratase